MPRIHVFNSLLLLILWIVQGSGEAFPPTYFALNVSQNLIKIYCSLTFFHILKLNTSLIFKTGK